MWIWYVIGALALIFVGNMFFVVRQQTVAVVERFGRFKKVAYAGLNLKAPFIDRIVAKPSLRIQQLDVEIETKTKDNVFVRSTAYCPKKSSMPSTSCRILVSKLRPTSLTQSGPAFRQLFWMMFSKRKMISL
jgi:regulator of protease activity HflC (stomatin/prohibitin superfamily)